jgi:hypothetical protein
VRKRNDIAPPARVSLPTVCTHAKRARPPPSGPRRPRSLARGALRGGRIGAVQTRPVVRSQLASEKWLCCPAAHKRDFKPAAKRGEMMHEVIS